MKKIGIITFHWATNYGAILQAYALQRYLSDYCNVNIINYIPIIDKIRSRLSLVKNFKFLELLTNSIKEYKFNKFRKKHLKLSKKCYFNTTLKSKCNYYDIYICGSDQIWNEYFTLNGEMKPTLSYYLNFVASNKIKIAYAASFGNNELSDKAYKIIKPELVKFNYISVREKSAIKILETMGLESQLVIDPTLLIRKEVYESLLINYKCKMKCNFFSYTLHNNQHTIQETSDYIYNKYFDKNTESRYVNKPISVLDWIYGIKNCKFVLTNSFHGMVFALIFHKPFIVIPVEGKKINDRFYTLLSNLNLENRIIEKFNPHNIDLLMQETINWTEIDGKITKFREKSINFLQGVIN